MQMALDCDVEKPKALSKTIEHRRDTSLNSKDDNHDTSSMLKFGVFNKPRPMPILRSSEQWLNFECSIYFIILVFGSYCGPYIKF